LIVVRYFYSLTPLFLVGTLVLLSLPWLGVIALMFVLFALLEAVAALALAIASTLGMARHAISRRQVREPALSATPTQLLPAGATVLLASGRSEREA
jgi:hypothetical protein